MNYRYSELFPQETVDKDKTVPIALDFSDKISRLDIVHKMSAAAIGMSAPSHAAVTKIEIIDGSDVLFSLDGGQCQALNIYDRKVQTMNHGQHYHNNNDFATFGIDFGRTLWDRELAFDPKKFTNPKLNITIDIDAVYAGQTETALVVYAHLFDEKAVSPQGFLMSKEHYRFTPGSEGTYSPVELPQDYIMRRMLLQGYRSGYEPWNVLSEVRIDENNDKRIPFDVNLEEYHRIRKGIDPMVCEDFICQPSPGGTVFYTTPTSYYTPAYGLGYGTTDFNLAAMSRAGKVTLKSATTSAFYGEVRGYLPNHCFNFPFGMENDMADWFDPRIEGKVRMRVTAGGSEENGSGRVVLQQMRPY